MDVKIGPDEEVVYLMKKTGSEQASYKAQFFPRLIYIDLCTAE